MGFYNHMDRCKHYPERCKLYRTRSKFYPNRCKFYPECSKFWADLLALLISVTVLFSVFYLAIEMNHDCVGDNCPICESMRLCEQNLRQSDTGFTRLIAVIAPVILFLFAIVACFDYLRQSSPVTEKIRMND